MPSFRNPFLKMCNLARWWDYCVDCVVGKNCCGCYIVVDSTRNVDKVESSFHICGHSSCVDIEFLLNVLFEGCAAPSAHFCISRLEYPHKANAFAPQMRKECVSTLSMGIPLSAGYSSAMAASLRALLISLSVILFSCG